MKPPPLHLSPGARQHLVEVMTGEADGTDPACLGCAEILRALGIDPATVPRHPSPEPYLRALLSALKQWRQATESRLRLLDSRGEARRAMIDADAALCDALDAVEAAWCERQDL